MRLSVAVLVPAIALAASAPLAHAAHGPHSADALAALQPFVGEWEGTGEMYATAYSAAATTSARTSCDWTKNHGFLLCDQLVHMGDHAENDLSVYTYDDSTRAYQFFGISRGVGRARTPALTIVGRTWTYSSEFTDRAGHHVQIRTVNDVQDTLITYRTEFTPDGGAHWTVMGKGASRRVR